MVRPAPQCAAASDTSLANLSGRPATPYVGAAGREGVPFIRSNVKSSQNATSPNIEPLDEAVALAYRELRAIAHRRLHARGAHGTLSTTALVHEAYLKLVDTSRPEWRDREHFLALASLVMRHVLVDRAREISTLKRGGVRQRITFDE